MITRPKRLDPNVPLTARLRSSYRWYMEHPEDFKTVGGAKFAEKLRRNFPSVYVEFIRGFENRV
jgi:hypothetical protein